LCYTHLTTDELVLIESYAKINKSVARSAQLLKRSRQTIHKVYLFLKKGNTALDYYRQYKENKKNCGRHLTRLPESQKEYVQKMVAQGWTPDVSLDVKITQLPVLFGRSIAYLIEKYLTDLSYP